MKKEPKLIGTLTLEETNRILVLREDGLSSREIANKIGRTLVVVNESIKANISGVSLEKIEEKEITNIEKVAPAARGHFRKIVGDKIEQNEALRERQSALADAVKGLLKMNKILEMRKKKLEDYIESMEQYLMKGSDVLDFFRDKVIKQELDKGEE